MYLLRDYAVSFVGTRYRWGGDNPLVGYDCSGFVQEILKSVGMDPPGDQTAQGLYNFFEPKSTAGVFRCGALAFYGASVKQISHVAIMVDPYRIVEAGGGGPNVKTRETAEQLGAFVRVRLVKYRSDFLVTLFPGYPTIGVPL